jgi:hypothetical protein
MSKLPKRTDALLVMLRDDPALRTRLVDAGLRAWRQTGHRGASFSWRGRRFRVAGSNFRFTVRDARSRPLVCRWH